ncbi:MAG: hypothetical protein WC924_04425 [Candidatus Gracilibacteria bacterium]
MTDEELYEKALMYGRNALLWRQKFMGLLPEVQRRRLYEKKGFGSIFEFAFKLAGLSEEQVRRVLNLEKRFSNRPVLKKLLTEGEVSMYKLARVASIVTSQNEEALAQAVQALPQSAIETLVRDENGLNGPQIELKSVRAHTLELNNELTQRLLELQGKGIDVNEVLTELLDRREQEIEEEKLAIASDLKETHSRYIPVKTKVVMHKEYGTKCSIRTCYKPAEHLHHTQIFALSHVHDPHYLAPLCKEHHVIAHAINVKVGSMKVQNRSGV